MTTIFLCHSPKDKADACKLKDWLEAEERGHCVFIDSAVDTGIKGGEDWEQKLYEQLKACRIFLPLFSRNWVDSKWCFGEMVYARSAGKTIVPVRIESDIDIPGVFADVQQIEIDLTADQSDGYGRLGLALGSVFPWDDPRRPPYPGLMAFREDEAALYNGRESEIAAGREML